ncbi:OLC1v1037345C1 [Oldenlandia corymbosa var. corymbosa]|uniref:OLC1v1037345C1 n=1 Tax=Oldenlandia corymbosa var. corymbosa TaxID=529605 RepID=A0AAV1CZL3_OLDCO|nr:OLC1v1037345C1 [Oldenlandia corymbosa var. corymbosa]
MTNFRSPAVPFPLEEEYKDWSVWSLDIAAGWARRVMCSVAAQTVDGDRFVTVYGVGPGGCRIVFPDEPVESFMPTNEILFSKPYRGKDIASIRYLGPDPFL